MKAEGGRMNCSPPNRLGGDQKTKLAWEAVKLQVW
jgi:hypothetical protein